MDLYEFMIYCDITTHTKNHKLSAMLASGEVLCPKSGDEVALDVGEVHLSWDHEDTWRLQSQKMPENKDISNQTGIIKWQKHVQSLTITI